MTISDTPIKDCPDGEPHRSHLWLGFDPEMMDFRCPGVAPDPFDQPPPRDWSPRDNEVLAAIDAWERRNGS